MRRIYVVEELCNGCRLCQTFCSSLRDGVFSQEGRIQVLKVPGEDRDIPFVDCSGHCVRAIYGNGTPTCVAVCPTGALIYAEQEEAIRKRLEWEEARQTQALFKVIAPWKWPFPWVSEVPLKPNVWSSSSS
jgi:Fe-S-cluster-containing dehydrogenase component